MDLQWQRQTELWLRLIGAQGAPVLLPSVVVQADDRLYLEALAGRALLSVARALPDDMRQPAFFRLLTRIRPEAAEGTLFRVWMANGCVCLAATAPAASGAELWAQLTRQQQRLLDSVTRGLYENQ
jgi:hypothetical protein